MREFTKYFFAEVFERPLFSAANRLHSQWHMVVSALANLLLGFPILFREYLSEE